MQLIFFDLDGTLLNDASEISVFTKETLKLLGEKDIAYTVATGRTMLSAQRIVEGHNFTLPHIFNNGVTVWDPNSKEVTLENLLDSDEISTVIEVALSHGITPFINVIDNHHKHFIFHAKIQHEIEKDLIEKYFAGSMATLLPLETLPTGSQVTNISMIGDATGIKKMWHFFNSHNNLIAYSGPAIQGGNFWWMDVHHKRANKGSAVTNLKNKLGASKVICFGDGDNDLSMFAEADECYAPENAKSEIKESAHGVIGHNHEDGIAHFLRERFSL
ncbi:Cof-type HAD-IIB family hydrolase [uncultured Paraglaciecola sp.]|uniref:HAD family hydrolase n=1 Tax=uncultured Paraglaciecola sp. TaxID=1765024 RepID=UPI0025961C3B|nr:Cof-type HAD-IIB family hydrolase [uncultured Paraglaciecola sp.]